MKRGLRQAAVGLARTAFRAGGERLHRLVGEALAVDGENLMLCIETVTTPRGAIRFYCLGDVSLWRARTLQTKEPETIEWIDTFAEGEVFWDVGANIGIYSLYAAAERKARVLAFEPSSANYALINRNIELNALDGLVQAYCLALSDRKGLNALNMLSTGFGGASSSFGTTIDESGQRFVPKFRQGMVGYSIDRFIADFNPPFPNHLKIDVDGIEDCIVAGAEKTLGDWRLKSASIELDATRSDYTDAVVAKVVAAGLQFVSKRHSAMFDGGPYAHLYNYRFSRV